MKKHLVLILAAIFSITACGDKDTTKKAHWSYGGSDGPANWAKLSADNGACAGKNQSPINLTGFIESDLPPLTFNYQTDAKEVLNNGHAVQINYSQGSSLVVDGTTFNLLQIHFHAPSENHINGKSYPVEGHLVHADENGNLAVVAVMYDTGAENSGLAKAWAKMPEKAGDNNALSESLSVNELLPSDRDYYRFNGSLTTPPCSEGVRWLVLKKPMTASKQQIDALTAVLHEPNNRPIQPLNARPVLQ